VPITASSRSGVDEGAGEHPASDLHAEHAIDGLVDALLGQLAGPYRGEHGVVRQIDVDRHEELVDARFQCENRNPGVAVLLAHAGHGQRVGDDDTVVSQPLAQHVGDDRTGQRRWITSGVARTDTP
jgi:hypothetical protein